MFYLAVALVYLAFFGMIGVACWVTKSAWPLFALIFAPSIRRGAAKDEEDDEGL